MSMLEIISHPAFRGKQEVETSTKTVRRVLEALRCKPNNAEEPFVRSSRKDSNPDMMPNPEQ